MPSIQISEERGVRQLHFGGDYIQGAMRIARPWALELEYTRDMMLPLLLRDEAWPATVLQVGLGAASVTKFLYRHRPHARLTVVEIEPQVVRTARDCFRLPEDPGRIHIEIGDGYEYMGARRARFDLVAVDGYDEKGRAGMLDTEPFYHQCRERLAKDGLLVVNLLTRRRKAEPSLQRLRAAFGGHVLEIPPGEAGNLVAVAGRRAFALDFEELRGAARRLKASTGLNLLPAVARLQG